MTEIVAKLVLVAPICGGTRVIGMVMLAVLVVARGDPLLPVAAITLGVLLLGERLTLAMLAGAGPVIAGVWIINRPAGAMPAPAMAPHHP